jgi:hypothetical protein
MPTPINPEKKTYLDNYVQFGSRTQINIRKLEDNIILIKYIKNLGPLKNFPAQRHISNELKMILQDLIETGKINVDAQKKLSQPDIQLFERILSLCKLKNYLQYKRYVPTIDDHIERFELLRSSLVAGNQSEEIKQELVELIKLLSNPFVSKISVEDANEFIELLS